jgi:DNA polymerase III subunit beta
MIPIPTDQDTPTATTLFTVPPAAPSPSSTTTPAMLHCRVSRDTLVPVLALLQSVAETRSTVPMLAHLSLEAQASGTLELRATDLEIGLRCRCPATVTLPGTCTVDARRFYDIVRALPAGELHLSTSPTEHGGLVLTLRCEKSRFRLISLDPGEFPLLQSPSGEMATFPLPVATLRAMIARTLFCVPPDPSRPHLHGVFCEPSATDWVRLVASDGHRLAVVDRAVPGRPPALPSVLLPAKGVMEARKLLEGTSEEIATLAVSEALATLTVGETMLTLRLGESAFPEYRAVLAAAGPHQLSVKRTDLLAALRRVLILTTERDRGVTVAIRPDLLTLSVATGAVGEGTEELPIAYRGEPLTLGFNARYLLDVVVALDPAEQIILALHDERAPVLMWTEEDVGFRYVVMPMRIR